MAHDEMIKSIKSNKTKDESAKFLAKLHNEVTNDMHKGEKAIFADAENEIKQQNMARNKMVKAKQPKMRVK